MTPCDISEFGYPVPGKTSAISGRLINRANLEVASKSKDLHREPQRKQIPIPTLDA
jgi:hypothetical protein